MISIKGLNKIYSNGTKAVNDLSLEVNEGEILALLGPNGAGKSSVIKILTTLSGFDDGNVEVAGFNVDSHEEKVRQSIGYVAQETGVDYFLTGRENLELQGHLYRMKKAEIHKRIDELGEYFGLSNDVLNNMVSSYSGGMRRKLDIATALIHQPKVLFLDEPTLGLDTQSRQSLWQYIRKLNGELGLTILLTTHYLDEADKLSSRVAIIDKGEIKIIDTAENLKDKIHGDVVTLQINNPDNKQQIADTLAKNDFVKDSMWEKDKLHLYVSNGAASIASLIENCNRISCEVINVSYARPTLDDVFIMHTGASIDAKEDGGEEKWWEKWAGKGGGGKWAKKWQDQNAEGDDAQEEKQWTEEEVESWHKNKEWSEEESKNWEGNKQWSKEEAAAWHSSQEKTDSEKTSDNASNSSSDSEKEWSAEEVDNWHKNKKWSEEEAKNWEDNKQWSKEDAAQWHEKKPQSDDSSNQQQEKSSENNNWPDSGDGNWSEEEKENWKNKSQWSNQKKH